MNNKCLALYDVTQIQKFIFSSSRTRENLGASIYLRWLFDERLRGILDSIDDNEDGRDEGGAALLSDSSRKSEVIYCGGGNAMILFPSREKALQATRRLSDIILSDTRNTLGIAVGYRDTDLTGSFQDDLKALRQDLDRHKAEKIVSRPLAGFSITRECADGQPSSGKKREKLGKREKGKKGEYISDASHTRLKFAEDRKAFHHLRPGNYDFPLEFDNLGGKKGEQSQIAVVHIDGNGMGAFLKKKLADQTAYSRAITTLRRLSREIEEAYECAFAQVCAELAENMGREEVCEVIKCRNNELPIRPLILAGDDVAFVCDGRIALQTAARFLELLAMRKIDAEPLSACAGIAIVGSHFPFHRAYELAEELCANAKRSAGYHDKDRPGCWMDYHIVYSGFELDLDRMRRKTYSVPGMEQVATNNDRREPPRYNLLLRPFPVAGIRGDDPPWRWKDIERMSKAIRTWPRSKHKELRNAFAASRDAVEEVQKHAASRKHVLPAFTLGRGKSFEENPKALFHDNQTPYYEPLEMMDFYLSEVRLGGQSGNREVAQ